MAAALTAVSAASLCSFAKGVVIKNEQLLHYLLRHDLLLPTEVIDMGVELVDEVRDRTLLTRVTVGETPTYMVKQAVATEYRGNIEQEARAYACLQGIEMVRDCTPPLVRADRRNAILVMGWVDSAGMEGGLSNDEREGRLASLVGYLHAVTADTLGKVAPVEQPWVLSCLGSDAGWRPHGLESVVNRAVRPNLLQVGLEEARSRWQPDALVHGDLKQEHCLVVRRDGNADICLLDWELAGYGDSAWDIGSMLSDTLFVRGYESGLHGISVAAMIEQGILDETLHRYRRYLSPAPDTLYRAVLFTGARLLQTGFESAAVYGLGPDSGVDLVLAMAEEIFSDPQRFSLLLARGVADG